jgi:hypothetical protein
LTFGLLTLVFYERNKGIQAAFFPMLGFFIKIFGGLGGFLLFFYPKFWRNATAYLIWAVVIGASPALIVGIGELPQLYTQWLTSLMDGHSTENEPHLMSLMHFIKACSPIAVPFAWIQMSGLFGLLIFLFYTRLLKTNTLWLRLNVLAYLLMWVVLFNHAAESNTHIISVGGAALWYVAGFTTAQPLRERSYLDNFLILFVVVLTCLGETDLFPHYIRDHYVFVYALKALPITLVWLKLQYDVVRKTE